MKAGPWSRRSSEDTLTSDTLTNFLNTSASSMRSSSASLPFAEEAINQNQQEWEHIERIFYGEEPLPADQKTREEFLDWMETFPYLRVVGQKVNTDRFRTGRNPIYHEETLVIDPPPPNRRLEEQHCRDYGVKSSVVGSRSGQILARRYPCDCDDPRHYSKDIPGLRGSSLTPREITKPNKDFVVMTARPGGLASNSANLFRLPSIPPTKWSGFSRHPQKTSKPSPLKSTITLPILNVDKLLTFGDLLTTRSISAAVLNNKDGPGGGTR